MMEIVSAQMTVTCRREKGRLPLDFGDGAQFSLTSQTGVETERNVEKSNTSHYCCASLRIKNDLGKQAMEQDGWRRPLHFSAVLLRLSRTIMQIFLIPGSVHCNGPEVDILLEVVLNSTYAGSWAS